MFPTQNYRRVTILAKPEENFTLISASGSILRVWLYELIQKPNRTEEMGRGQRPESPIIVTNQKRVVVETSTLSVHWELKYIINNIFR